MCAKPPLRRCRTWRGATRPTAANRLCTCTSALGRSRPKPRPQPRAQEPGLPKGKAIGKGCELGETALHQRA